MSVFIGSIIDSLLIVGAGVYVQFFWNRKVQKNIDLGIEDPDKLNKIKKKNGTFYGWLVIGIGLVMLATRCIDYFS
jgi:hypothetical protein